jgi:hypothetical protein
MHRAAVGVVGGVGDQLVIRGQRQRLVEREGIVGFQDALAAVVERAVADAESAGGNKIAMVA